MPEQLVDLISGLVRVGQVRYWPLEIVQLPEDGFAVHLRFELVPARYVAVFPQLRFLDPRVEITDLRWAGESQPTTSVHVLPGGAVGWLVGDPVGVTSIPLDCRVFALVKVPVDSVALTASVRFDATVAQWLPFGRVRWEHAHTAAPVTFPVTLPVGWAGVVPVRPVSRTGTPRSGVRLCMAADMERFSRFRLPEAARAQERFVEILASARAHAGIQDADVSLQESGDGQFAVLPTGLDETYVIPKLVEGLGRALAAANSDLSDRARLRLRVALHRGHVAPARNGWVGRSTIAVHRMLDSDSLRSALAGAPAADFALIVSDILYQEVIVHRYELLDPDRFVSVVVDVSAKDYAEDAWVYTPGHG